MIKIKSILSSLSDEKDFYFWSILGLTFSHLITSLYWFFGKAWFKFSSENISTYCFPFFKNCTEYSFQDLTFIKAIFIFYLLLCLINLIFIILKYNKISYVIFLALLLIKISILFSRYNFMGNYHTMHLSMVIIFLISNGTQLSYRFTLCLQYFFAGLLKLNLEWMSGAALVNYHKYLFPGFLHQLSLSYVVVLELFLIWGLLFESRFIRIITLIQIIFFHTYSYLIVGSYYPLIMFGLLLPILINDLYDNQQRYLEEFLRLDKIKIIKFFIFIFIFISWNLSAKFQGIDPSKDGNVRFFSLNMLDAKLDCNYQLIELLPNGNIRSLIIPELSRSIRIKCDPIVYESYLRRLCKLDPDRKLSFQFSSKKSTSRNYEEVRQYHDFCSEI